MRFNKYNLFRMMSLQVFRPSPLAVLMPAPDNVICTPGIEITVCAADDVCKPGYIQWAIGLIWNVTKFYLLF